MMRGRARFQRFLLLGGVAALVNVVSRYLLTPALGFSPAIVAGYLIGMIVAWLLFRIYVFTPSVDGGHRELARFALVNIIGITQVWLVSMVLAEFLLPWFGVTWHAKDMAHIVGVMVPAGTSYIGHKHFTFGAGVIFLLLAVC